MKQEPILSLRNVGVFYRRKRGIFRGEPFWALKDVSLDLYQGETLGIVGRNGAGKSTLLQLLAGIIKPDRGIYAKNKAYHASLLALQIGFIHYLTGRENAIRGWEELGRHDGVARSRARGEAHRGHGEAAGSHGIGLQRRHAGAL